MRLLLPFFITNPVFNGFNQFNQLRCFSRDIAFCCFADESQLLSASNGDYTGRKWLPGKKPEKLNKKRSLPLNQLSITKLGWPAKQELSFPQEYDPPALG